ncbi:hypothetical protein [Tenacibaculum amylolyticum]|uniref:hypothetical protein n=1 Tax=Tenacibaculum amylolyticum TaxID=104269 RepID=UPI0038950C39
MFKFKKSLLFASVVAFSLLSCNDELQNEIIEKQPNAEVANTAYTRNATTLPTDNGSTTFNGVTNLPNSTVIALDISNLTDLSDDQAIIYDVRTSIINQLIELTNRRFKTLREVTFINPNGPLDPSMTPDHTITFLEKNTLANGEFEAKYPSNRSSVSNIIYVNNFAFNRDFQVANARKFKLKTLRAILKSVGIANEFHSCLPSIVSSTSNVNENLPSDIVNPILTREAANTIDGIFRESHTGNPTNCVATPALTNIALNKPVQLSTTFPGYPGSRLTDGVRTGGDSAVAHTSKVAGQVSWARIDLQENTHHITGVVVYNRTTCCWNRLGEFNIIFSTQPLDMSQSLTDIEQQAGYVTRIAASLPGDGSKPIHITKDGLDIHGVRYVYIRQNTPNEYLNLVEVLVMGD